MLRNLKSFIDYSEYCPVCENKLHLYMTCIGGITFKAKQKKIQGKKTYVFEQALCKNDNIGQGDYFSIIDNGSELKTKFSSSKLAEIAKDHQIYFFQICDETKIVDSKKDFSIKMDTACYYRSTPVMHFALNDKEKWILTKNQPDGENLSMRKEVYSFNRKNKDTEYRYILEMGYETKETKFWHYTITDEQKKMVNFKPKTFAKTLPLLGSKIKLGTEDRDKLLDRFDSWIIVS